MFLERGKGELGEGRLGTKIQLGRRSKFQYSIALNDDDRLQQHIKLFMKNQKAPNTNDKEMKMLIQLSSFDHCTSYRHTELTPNTLYICIMILCRLKRKKIKNQRLSHKLDSSPLLLMVPLSTHFRRPKKPPDYPQSACLLNTWLCYFSLLPLKPMTITTTQSNHPISHLDVHTVSHYPSYNLGTTQLSARSSQLSLPSPFCPEQGLASL